ncbi:MAG: DnaJ domain-containing protein [Candidatus Melainabacteria bacterium]|nr:DnaJ domain-containing protein [Candidatus Melainabacteria bacterium]
MGKRENYYEVLGVSPEINSDGIKKAFRQLVKKHHPDLEYSKQDANQRVQAKEVMQKINQAYEILIDRRKRTEYDKTIGLRNVSLERVRQQVNKAKNEELLREVFLGTVFHPARKSIVKILSQYKKRCGELELDIYDDQLLENFSDYVDSIEKTLRAASNSLTDNPPPESLEGSVRWMRHCIAQASDGLDELNYFRSNFDYDHLSMAGTLFKIALEHAAKAQQLVKLL